MGASKSKPGFLYYSKLKRESWAEKTDRSLCLLLIDPQNDFVLPTGSLSVPGAIDDCNRLAEALRANKDKISDVFVTLDTHQKYHIAHPMFWTNDQNESPKPFSKISVEDIESGKWRPVRSSHAEWAREYTKKLKEGGRFQLTIWPEHCLIGSEGHAVYAPLMHSLQEWEAHKKSTATFVMKGNNAFTEHYSAIRAEVVMSEDPRTQLNTTLIKQLAKYETIVIAGEALSHCVNFTVRDFVANLSKSDLRKVVVLSDACSPVAGFEKEGTKFKDDMVALGITFASTREVFA